MYNRWTMFDARQKVQEMLSVLQDSQMRLEQNIIIREGEHMILEIDFNSDEALYIQLRNQIVIGIATSQLSAGDSLPSVRQLADRVGINMHTVNKAYTVLRQEGYVKLDRRKGAVIAIDCNKASARNKLLRDLQVMLAGAMCKGITRDEVHEMIDMIYDYYEQPANYPEEG